MKLISKLCLIICLLCNMNLLAQTNDVTNTPGSPAPAIAVQKWLKGIPVTEFNKKDIYVVEFWATWCKPCIAAMPHLSEISRKNQPSVKVLAINVLEEPGSEKRVEKFVNDMGDNMDFPVAIDKQMYQEWMVKAGQTGIPKTFVVDRKGNIAWIGHPLDLDSVLRLAMNGDIDYSAAAKDVTINTDAYFLFPPSNEEINSARQLMWTRIQEKDYVGALEVFENFQKQSVDISNNLKDLQNKALLHINEEQAFTMALNYIASNGQWQLDMLYWIAETDSLPVKFYELAIKIFQPLAVTPGFRGQPLVIEGLANAYYRAKRFDEAIATEQKWVDHMTIGKWNESEIAPAIKRLQKFQEAAKNATPGIK